MQAPMNPRYAFTIEGNPANDAAKAVALARVGPLNVAGEHVMAVLLPDALPAYAGGPRKIFNMLTMDTVSIGDMTIAAEMLVAGMHFVVYCDRYAHLLEDLERNGLDMTPIHGDIMTAGPILHERMSAAIGQLPAAQRHISLTDVFYHSPARDNPETGGWYDHINPAMLIAEGGMPCVARFKSITPGHYAGNATAGNRRSVQFECITDGIIQNVGRSVADAPQPSQAATGACI